MHKRLSRGFTLVELIVVMVIIALLTTVSIIAYQNVLVNTHDSKRSSDILAMMHELEKYYDANGEYPPGCIEVAPCQSISGNNQKSGDGSMFNTSSTQLTASSSLSQIRQVLPGIGSGFGDPVNISTNPITNGINGSSDQYKYLYAGGLTNNSSSSQNYYLSLANGSGYTPFGCTLYYTLQPGQRSGYFVGYYKEDDKKWHILHGLHEIETLQSSYSSAAAGIWCWGSTSAVLDN